MKVFDITKTIELTNYDLKKGYLKNDFLIKNLPAQQEEKEVYHYETIKTYPNGGKSVRKIIDKEYVPYLPEREVKEYIQVYIEYTAKELKSIENRDEIHKLEQWFINYDRICIEYARCQRLGIECHHNIVEWDRQAIVNINRLNELRKDI